MRKNGEFVGQKIDMLRFFKHTYKFSLTIITKPI